jgi:mono/diheme cytochrome c family protein
MAKPFRAYSIVIVAAAIVFGVVILANAQDDSTAHEYTIYCARCHGDDGRGDGVYARKLHAHPRDFTNCAVMAPIPDATIVKAIEQGGEAVGLSNEMPSWQGALDDDEIAALAKYIRGFCEKTPSSSAPQ